MSPTEICDSEPFFVMDEEDTVEENPKEIAMRAVNNAIAKVMALQRNSRWNIQEINYATINALGEPIEFDYIQNQGFSIVYLQDGQRHRGELGRVKIADKTISYNKGVYSEDKIVSEVADLVEDFFKSRYILKKEFDAFKKRFTPKK